MLEARASSQSLEGRIARLIGFKKYINGIGAHLTNCDILVSKCNYLFNI